MRTPSRAQSSGGLSSSWVGARQFLGRSPASLWIGRSWREVPARGSVPWPGHSQNVHPQPWAQHSCNAACTSTSLCPHCARESRPCTCSHPSVKPEHQVQSDTSTTGGSNPGVHDASGTTSSEFAHTVPVGPCFTPAPRLNCPSSGCGLVTAEITAVLLHFSQRTTRQSHPATELGGLKLKNDGPKSSLVSLQGVASPLLTNGCGREFKRLSVEGPRDHVWCAA